ncbi:hypothetical protein NIES22_70730 (plasmid) [Calothrix brevissima NIES-22]|nr:hypothetical protein NIES22_70730 [Calothrix brevissima NIES-22]
MNTKPQLPFGGDPEVLNRMVESFKQPKLMLMTNRDRLKFLHALLIERLIAEKDVQGILEAIAALRSEQNQEISDKPALSSVLGNISITALLLLITAAFFNPGFIGVNCDTITNGKSTFTNRSDYCQAVRRANRFFNNYTKEITKTQEPDKD